MNIRRTTWGLGLLGTLALAACGGDDTTPTNSSDASTSSEGSTSEASTSPDGGASEAATSEGGGEGGLTGPALIARGDYLVNHVDACGDCHTPRTAMGALDLTKNLSGSAMPFADLDPTDPAKGAVYVRNLTPDMTTGLGAWTAAQIKTAFRDGKDKDGAVLFPIMPYYVFHNMSDQDADAIVAYLKSIPAVVNAVPKDQPLPIVLPVPVNPLDKALIPNTTLAKTDPNYAKAVAGRYLAAEAGICIECHTKHLMGLDVLDKTAFFAGNESFDAMGLGLPVPLFPANIYSANITPDGTGLMGWVAADVIKVLKTGVDKKGAALCPPMPFGPMGAFGGLTDDDALNIATYITTLPPIANPNIPFCVAPAPPPGEGGVSEGGAPDAATSDGAAE